MRELQQKQKAKQRLYSFPVLIILGLVTFLIAHGAYSVLKKKQESAVYVAELQTKVEDLSNHQYEVKSNISRLQTEEGIDTEIKKKFSVSKAGEHVVVIVDPRVPTSHVEATSTPWYTKFINKLKYLW
ncbi:hypothetical protein BH11PAT3_BH11PAT3_2940 [soil metagenome]